MVLRLPSAEVVEPGSQLQVIIFHCTCQALFLGAKVEAISQTTKDAPTKEDLLEMSFNKVHSPLCGFQSPAQ